MKEILVTCATDCNNCKELQNRKVSYLILASLAMKSKDVYPFVNKMCPNMTVCPECRVDDFTHVESCSIGKMLEPNIKIKIKMNYEPNYKES